MSEIKSNYIFDIDDTKYLFQIMSKTLCKISSEYYAKFFQEKTYKISKGIESKPDVSQSHSVPNTYLPYSIKILNIQLDDSKNIKKKFKESFKKLSNNFIQFPILIISGEFSGHKIKKIIKYTEDFANNNKLYFLLYFKDNKNVLDIIKNKNETSEVHYSTGNRVFIKQLISVNSITENSDLTRSDFYLDLKDSNSIDSFDFEILNKYQQQFYDDYSDMDIKYGPNLWIDCSLKINPNRLLELLDIIKPCSLNKLFLNAFFHRFFNMIPSKEYSSFEGSLNLDEDGEVYIQQFGKNHSPIKDLKSPINNKVKCNCKCLDFSQFCSQNKKHCSYYKSIFKKVVNR